MTSDPKWPVMSVGRTYSPDHSRHGPYVIS